MVVLVGWLGEEGDVESMEIVVSGRCDFSSHFSVVSVYIYLAEFFIRHQLVCIHPL